MRDSPDHREEPVTTPCDRLNVSRLSTIIAQSAAQREDVLRQICLLDKRVRPNFFQQLILLDQLSRMLHEHDQYLGGFGCERNAFTITREDSLTRIQLIWSEFVAQIIVAHRFRESRFQPKRCIFQPAPVTQVVEFCQTAALTSLEFASSQ